MIEELIKKARSYRNYVGDYKIERETLEELVNLARFSGSTKNRQVLRFYLSCEEETNQLIFHEIYWARSLKNVKLPFPGNEPAAYIVICQDPRIQVTQKGSDTDTGIAAQSMMLGAVEKGLNGCFLADFNPDKLRDALGLDEYLKPALVFAIGKANETVVLVDAEDPDDVVFYRDGNTNYVPKRKLEDLIINK